MTSAISTHSDQSAAGKEPWLAVNFSLFFPGLGQFYAGARWRGLGYLLGYLGLTLGGIALILIPESNPLLGFVCLIAAMGVFVVNLFDAYHCTRSKNHPEFEILRRSDKDAWFAVLLSQILPGLGHLYLGKFLLGIVVLLLGLALAIALPPTLLIGSFSFNAAIAYLAYTSTPHRRESSKRAILIVCGFMVAIPLIVPSPTALNGVIETRYVVSESMEPTLYPGDRLIIEKFSYRFQDLQRGDIILFRLPEEAVLQNPELSMERFLKRVIGLPGETVQVKGGQVFIDRQPLIEPYVNEAPTYDWGPETLPDRHYFVLGDNRNNSYDSHLWGFLPQDQIIGQVLKLYWPPQRLDTMNHWDESPTFQE